MTGLMKSCVLRAGSPALLAALVGASVLGSPGTAAAQSTSWVLPAWAKALQVPLSAFVVPGRTPAVIPQLASQLDATGTITSYQPGGATVTADNAFFAALGTNGRTCFTCHQPQDGWALAPDTVLATFLASAGSDPLFAPVDGADCPDLVADDSDNACLDGFAELRRVVRFVEARRQLFTRANFRIFIPLPAHPEWRVRVVRDPYGCEQSPTYGLPAGFLSMYRRPLPSANTLFLDPQGTFNIMWDAREPTLESQFLDATLVHAQATAAQGQVAVERSAEGVAFQNGLFVAQSVDDRAGNLAAPGVTGGPQLLATLPPGTSSVTLGLPEWTLFDGWSTPSTAPSSPSSASASQKTKARASIARGQDLFNNRVFSVDDVPGLNDVLGQNPVAGTCALCHNNQNTGNDFFLGPKRLGIGDNGSSRGMPPSRDLPLFSFLCPPGAIPFFSNPVTVDGTAYDELLTTDPGQGLIDGTCADLGRIIVPVLRGLAARAPYFHDGSAATLRDVVDFYDVRFSMGLSADEKRDLASFLGAI